MSRTCRSYPPDFKLAVIERMASAPNITVLARELGLQRELLYLWQAKYRREGMAGLRSQGRPGAPASAMAPAAAVAPEARISALERKIGQQQLELDFFRQALRQVGQARQPDDGLGVPTSTPSSRRRRPGRKAS